MDSRVLNEGIVFLDHFAGTEDPRQQAKVIYPLSEVLLLCLLAVLAGGGDLYGCRVIKGNSLSHTAFAVCSAESQKFAGWQDKIA